MVSVSSGTEDLGWLKGFMDLDGRSFSRLLSMGKKGVERVGNYVLRGSSVFLCGGESEMFRYFSSMKRRHIVRFHENSLPTSLLFCSYLSSRALCP